jgi:hypothetical protein
MSKTKKGKIFSAEHKKNLSEARKKRITTEETKNKMSKTRKGKIFSAEHKKKLSEARKLYWKNKKNISHNII